MTVQTIHLSLNGQPCRVRITPRAQGNAIYEFATDTGSGAGGWQAIDADIRAISPGAFSLLLPDGTSVLAQRDDSPLGQTVLLGGKRYTFAQNDPRSLTSRRSASSAETGPATIKSPMPGRVVRILQAKGSVVEAKQGVLVVEAMKMQNELKSPRAGTVETLLVAEGDSVAAGQALAVIR
jgi:biotin carboxyl carrier protein